MNKKKVKTNFCMGLRQNIPFKLFVHYKYKDKNHIYFTVLPLNLIFPASANILLQTNLFLTFSKERDCIFVSGCIFQLENPIKVATHRTGGFYLTQTKYAIVLCVLLFAFVFEFFISTKGAVIDLWLLITIPSILYHHKWTKQTSNGTRTISN